MIEKPTTGKHSINWPLFEHMAQDHRLYLTETEMHDIRAAARKCEEQEAKAVAPTVMNPIFALPYADLQEIHTLTGQVCGWRMSLPTKMILQAKEVHRRMAALRQAKAVASKVKAAGKVARPKPPKGYFLLDHPIQGAKRNSDILWSSEGLAWRPTYLKSQWNPMVTYARRVKGPR